ncbi:MAG: glycoside hydrolase family 43 protein [Prevotella sp.]|nr:glycoside hydrolase family 43 protein [Prevotella sp.]MBQ9204808.1 glycoside hydrolase family 43 protein [Prevotella sp.]
MIEQVEITLKSKSRSFHLVTNEILSQLPKLPKTGILQLLSDMKRRLILTMVLLISIVAGAKEKGTTVAHFSQFTYTGQDDYYRENPLTDAAQFYNPILPGWYSDPAICRVGEDYWLVTSTFGYYPGVPLYHSRDLVNWQLVGNILCRPSQLAYLKGQSIDKGGIYAPTIAYNPQNQTYYMITTDVGKGHFYVTTRDPWGEWSDPVFLPQIGGIDPAFFFDDDGQAYIVHKEDTEGQPKWSNHRSIRFIRFNVETGQTYGDDIPLREEGVGLEEQLPRDEGPHLYKIRGKYYLICAEGGTSWAHSEVAYKADSVFGPYKRWPRSPMLTQRLRKAGAKYGVSCTGHADLVETPNGEWWAVFLGCRQWQDGTEQLGRETFMMPVKWSLDGYPYITQTRDSIPLMLRREGVVRKEKTTYGNFAWNDDFSSSELRPEWLSLRGPLPVGCSQKKGLHLACSSETARGTQTPAYLGRRIQHHKFTVETTLSFSPTTGDAAGILIFKNEAHQYFLCVTTDGIALRRINKRGFDILAQAPLAQSGTVNLKVVCRGLTYDFYYQPTGSDWLLLASDIDVRHVSSSVGGFTGTTIGLYAEHE